MSVSYWQNSIVQNSPKHYDVVVVGAGIAGVSVCYWLYKLFPQLTVALVDKNQLGSGASGRNAGFVTCGSLEHLMKLEAQWGIKTAAEIWKFSEFNHELLKSEILCSPTDIEYKTTGSCTVAPSETRLQEYTEFASSIRNYGISIDLLSKEDIEREFSLKGFFGGAFYPKDGEIHPVQLLHAILKKCKVDYFPNEEVFSYRELDAHAELLTRTESFSADAVFFTTNAELPLLFPEFKAIVQPGRGQILTTEPVPFTVRGPCYFTKDLCYFRQLPDGRLLVGGFRNLDPQGESTLVDATTPLIQEALSHFIQTRFVQSPNIKVTHRWSGSMAFTIDGQPLLGKHPTHKHVFLHAGCSGHGMGNNFHLAKVLVEHMDGKSVSNVFSIDRFKNEIIGA